MIRKIVPDETKEILTENLLTDETGPFSMSFAPDLSNLKLSMEKVGLIDPPLISPAKEQGKFWVVCGLRRALAAKELGWNLLRCRIAREFSPLEGLMFNLYENVATRTFNPVEKAMVLHRLEPLLEWEQISHEIMPVLGLPSHRPTFELYLRLETQLDGNLKVMLARGEMAVATAKMALDLAPEDSRVVGEVFSKIRFNINQQSQFIDLMDDISHQKKLSFSEILTMEETKAVMENPRITSARRAEALLSVLKGLRNPRAERAWNAMKRKTASLELPKKVRIQVPSYFEGTEYKIEISFKDGNELYSKLKNLIKIEALRKIKSPLEEAYIT